MLRPPWSASRTWLACRAQPRPDDRESWVVGYFDCGGDFASSSALSARRSGSASIRNTTDYCGHRPAHASKRMPPSMISTRPGQFAFSPNPAPGLRGSRVIGSTGFIAASRGTAEDFRRLASQMTSILASARLYSPKLPARPRYHQSPKAAWSLWQPSLA
jgi:hypothetical protein